jgi:hypothetical protein
MQARHGAQTNFTPAHLLHRQPPAAGLPTRPPIRELVRRTVADEATTLRDQLRESEAGKVVVLGQEAAEGFAATVDAEPLTLRPDTMYETPRPVRVIQGSVEASPFAVRST